MVKKIKKILIAIVLSIFLLNQCNTISKEKKSIKKKQVNIFKNTLRMSTYFNKVDYKLFNIPDSILIGNISAYFKLGNYQIIVDKRYSRSVDLFDKNGNFLKRLKRIGNGPGEYRKIVSCSIDKKNNHIILFDRQKINFYSIPNFKYIKSISVKGSGAFADMIFFNNYIYLYSISKFSDKLGLLGRINIKDNKREILIKKVPEILNRTSWIGKKQFAIYNDNLYFIPSFCSKIYKIDSLGKLSVKFKLYNKSIIISDYSEFLEDNISDKFKIIDRLSDYYTLIYTFCINNSSLLCLSIPYKNNQFFAYSTLKSDSINFYNNRINDVNGNSTEKYLFGKFVFNNINKYIESIQPEDLFDILIKTKNDKKIEKALYKKEIKNIPLILKDKLGTKNMPILEIFY